MCELALGCLVPFAVFSDRRQMLLLTGGRATNGHAGVKTGPRLRDSETLVFIKRVPVGGTHFTIAATSLEQAQAAANNLQTCHLFQVWPHF